MLKNILAVITASVSLAGCNAGTTEPISHTVKRPVLDRGPDGGPSGDQAGPQPATVPTNAAQAGTTDTATGTGEPGPGSNEAGTAARSSSLDASPARGTTGP